MKNHLSIVLFILLFPFFGNYKLFGEETLELSPTIEEAWELTRTHHPLARIEASALGEATQNAKQAGQGKNPQLQIRGENFGQSKPDILVGFSQEMDPAGVRRAERKVAERERDRLAVEFETRWLQLREEVERAFILALHQTHVVLWVRRDRDSSQVLSEKIAQMAKQGESTPDDLLRAEADRLRSENDLARAESLLATLKRGLAVAMGVPKSTILETRGKLEAPLLNLASLHHLRDGLRNLPLHRLGEVAGNIARSRLDLERAIARPSLTMELLHRHRGGDGSSGYDVALSAPLPWRDRRQAAIRAFELGIEKNLQEQLDLLLTATMEMERIHDDYLRNYDYSEKLKIEILPRYHDLLEKAEVKRTNGETSLMELLTTKREGYALRMAYLESCRDYRLAASELKKFISDEIAHDPPPPISR